MCRSIEEELRVYSIEYVLDKYGLTLKELFDMQLDKYDIDESDYIYMVSDNKYIIKNTFDGVTVEYGLYNSFNMAKRVVWKLIEVDWDKSELKRILKELRVWGS